MTGKDAVLRAFDRLFDRAALKLGVECDANERAEAKRDFAEQFSVALDAADQVAMDAVPHQVLTAMEESIDNLEPAQIVGQLATIPLAHQAHQILQALAHRATEQRLLSHLIEQADDSYGGN